MAWSRTNNRWPSPASPSRRATLRKQIMVATTSVGEPQADADLLTAAAITLVNRIPLLMLSGDLLRPSCVDPVLQQVETFTDPAVSVCDAFKPVVRFWDRISRPEQIIRSLPQALATMLDPADCGPAFFALPGCPSGGVRLPDGVLHRAVPLNPSVGPFPTAATSAPLPTSSRRRGAAGHRRRRGPLLGGQRRARPLVKRRAVPARQTPPARPRSAATILTTSARSASSFKLGQRRRRRRRRHRHDRNPTFRTSPRGSGGTRTPTPGSSSSTRIGGTPRSAQIAP